MPLPSAPASVANNFFNELRNIVSEDRFLSLKRYYDSLRKEIDDNKLDSLEYKSISDRLDTARYFYFPAEMTADNMNCFERSASLYFAFKELYPKSRPALVFLTDKNKNVHASLLFTHENELWGADPSFDYFDKIRLETDGIIVPRKEGTEQKIGFEYINEADDHTLEYIARKLRSDSGIIDFFYESGQRIAYSHLVFLHQSLFMKIKPDEKIVSEIRLFGSGFKEKNACIRFSADPSTGEQSTDFIRYDGESWGVLLEEQQEQPLIISPYKHQDITDTSHITQIQDVAFYLKNQQNYRISSDELIRFSNHNIVKGRFENVMDVARDIDEQTHLEFVKYLRFRYGSPENIKPSHRTAKGELNSLDSMIAEMKSIGEEGWETAHLQLVPAFLKFAEESRRYTDEVTRQINSRQ